MGINAQRHVHAYDQSPFSLYGSAAVERGSIGDACWNWRLGGLFKIGKLRLAMAELFDREAAVGGRSELLQTQRA